jgi:hypothetical protein
MASLRELAAIGHLAVSAERAVHIGEAIMLRPTAVKIKRHGNVASASVPE